MSLVAMNTLATFAVLLFAGLLSFCYGSTTTTVLQFSRPLTACDPAEDLSITQGTNKVIYAFDSNALSSHTSSLGQHSLQNRGTKSLNLLPLSAAQKSKHTTGDTTITLRLKNGQIAATGDSFVCRGFTVASSLEPKRHVIQIDPAIESSHIDLVHHMTLFECPPQISLSQEDLDFEGDCYNLPTNLHACLNHKPFGAWSTGGDSFVLPDDVGFAIGGSDGIHFALLQVHFDNHRGMSGIIDNSGFQLVISAALRSLDAGVLQIGRKESDIYVPAGMSLFETTGDCPGKCLNFSGTVNVFASLLHSHNYGRAMFVKHFRNGSELTELDRNNHYDTMFQQYTYFQNPVILKSGDALQLTCQYDTRLSSSAVHGGDLASQEMCTAYLPYFPKISTVGECMSSSGPISNLVSCDAFDSPVSYPALPKGLKLPVIANNETCLSFREPPQTIHKISGFFNGSHLYQSHSILDSMNRVHLYWNNQKTDIQMALEIQGFEQGWMGIGFSSSGGMGPFSDIYVATIVDSTFVVTDRYALTEATPLLDRNGMNVYNATMTVYSVSWASNLSPSHFYVYFVMMFIGVLVLQ
jgi:hypothetical protein